MLIPSIDLMGGKIVQLVQGEKKALESDDFDYWIDRFSAYPLVQLIDLDAAMGKGSNGELVSMICQRLPCQAGGGIRTIDRAQELLNAGAHRVIFGSSLLRDGKPNIAFAEECCARLGADRLTFAVDSRGGKVAIQGWRQVTGIKGYGPRKRSKRWRRSAWTPLSAWRCIRAQFPDQILSRWLDFQLMAHEYRPTKISTSRNGPKTK